MSSNVAEEKLRTVNATVQMRDVTWADVKAGDQVWYLWPQDGGKASVFGSFIVVDPTTCVLRNKSNVEVGMHQLKTLLMLASPARVAVEELEAPDLPEWFAPGCQVYYRTGIGTVPDKIIWQPWALNHLLVRRRKVALSFRFRGKFRFWRKESPYKFAIRGLNHWGGGVFTGYYSSEFIIEQKSPDLVVLNTGEYWLEIRETEP